MRISDQYLYLLYLQKHKEKQNKGAIGKDSERMKTYRAEWAFQAASKESIQTFDSIEQAQKFVNKVVASKTYSKLYDEAQNMKKNPSNIKVAAKLRNTGKGFAGQATYNTITLDAYAGMDVYTVLHELAHCVGHMHHGRSFRRDLLKLVSRFMSPDLAKKLKAEFKERKLSHGEPRKPMTFEKWQAAKVRMENLRERKQ